MSAEASSTTTQKKSQSPCDLILRVCLIQDQESLEELSPSVWRRVKVSAWINLDTLHDKILGPLMGWTRNYHAYYYKPLLFGDNNDNNKIYLMGGDCNAPDMMHSSMLFGSRELLDNPHSTLLGDLVTKVGDQLLYTYDLGDSWHHLIQVEEVRTSTADDDDDEAANGKCIVLGGAMRCPDEDGEGCRTYQEAVLDLVNKTRQNPFNDDDARNLASNCFQRHNAINVRGRFDPMEFRVAKCQEAINAALRSKASAYNGTKTFTSSLSMFGSKPFKFFRNGQRVVMTKMEDDRGGEGFLIDMTETINIKPDEREDALCAACGNPLNLRHCSACEAVWYCSKECQRQDWKQQGGGGGHKRQCKKEKAMVMTYLAEKEGTKNKNDSEDIDGGIIPLVKYDAENLRFKVGDRVECCVGPETYATGNIVRTFYREDHWPPSKASAPYQIQLDRSSANRMGIPHQHALIFSVWDDDHQIRLLPQGHSGSKARRMDIVD